MNEFQNKVQDMKDSMNEVMLESEETEISDNQEDRATRNEKGHRRGKRIKNRVNDLQHDNAVLGNQNQQLIALLQEQEARLAEAQAKAEQIAHNNNIYYENSLENEEQRILTEFKLAKENGDTEQEVMLSQRLADVTARKQTQKLHQALQQKERTQWQPPQPIQPIPQPQYFAPPPVEQSVNEYYEDWLEENSYADPNSPNYDQELSEEAEAIGRRAAKALKFNGGAHVIGTPEYYNIITNEMKFKYGINNNDAHEEESAYYPQQHQPLNQPRQSRQYAQEVPAYAVAPVSKKGSSMADRYVSTNYNNSARNNSAGGSLTQQEVNQAIRFAPVYTQMWGRTVSEEEAIAIYKSEKAKIPPEQRFHPGMQKLVLNQRY